MSNSRYSKRQLFMNADEGYYKKFFKYKRDVNQIMQYNTAIFNYPDPIDINEELTIDTEVWQVGTRMDKIAHRNYGDSTLWWLIAWFNKKPTEGSWNIGDVIYIPQPADRLIEIFERGQ